MRHPRPSRAFSARTARGPTRRARGNPPGCARGRATVFVETAPPLRPPPPPLFFLLLAPRHPKKKTKTPPLSRARARLDNAERLDKLQDERIEVLQHVQAYLVAQHAVAPNF